MRHDPRYRWLPPEVVPDTECLADVVDRMLPYWYDAIVPDLATGQTVLVAAHGNSLRALVKHLDAISDDEIAELNIPTGEPLVLRAGRRLPAGRAQAGRRALPALARGDPGGGRGGGPPGRGPAGLGVVPEREEGRRPEACAPPMRSADF